MAVVLIIIVVIYYAVKSGRPPVYETDYPLPPPVYYSYATYYTEKLRKKLLVFPKILCGTLTLAGFLTLFLGIILVDVSQSAPSVAAGAVESMVGLLLIFFSFRLYRSKIGYLSEEILPEVLSPGKR